MPSPVSGDDRLPAPAFSARSLRFAALEPGEQHLFLLPAERLLNGQRAWKTLLSSLVAYEDARAALGPRLVWDCAPLPAGRSRRRVEPSRRAEGLARLRRRAHHALRRLPWEIAANGQLGPTAAVLLDLFIRLPELEEASVAELAARTGVSARAVQYAAASLVVLGLLVRHERREAFDRNDTNRWELAGAAARAAERLRGEGANVCAPEERDIFISQPTSEPTSARRPARNGDGSPNRSSSVGRGKARQEGAARTGGAAPVPTPRPGPATNAELRLGLQALRHAAPDFPDPRTAADVWRAAELLIRASVPIYPGLWQAGARRHGFRAALAVLETAILKEVGHVRHPAAYLAGILRKPPAGSGEAPEDACCPHVTLSRLLAARSARAKRLAGDHA